MERDLKYGDILLFPANPIITNYLFLGIAIADNEIEEIVEMEVTKYWEDDTEVNTYKVKLISHKEEDKVRFGYENLYTSDLKSMIKRGTVRYKQE